MIEVIGGDLYQWDISRSVRIKPEQGKQVQKANFSNADIETARVTSAVKDGDYYIADIPDELLKSDQKLTCYAVMIDPDEEKTIEQASFKVNRRNRPDDYDINASTELRSMCDDILGEVVGNTIFDKLAYMKDCLDILYQSPPIKLMREVYGENRSLKELFEYLSEQQDCLINSSYIKKLTYESSYTQTGFIFDSKEIIHPDGSTIDGYYSFIMPKVIVYPDMSVVLSPICAINPNYKSDGTFTKYNLNIVDFRNVYFGTEDILELMNIGSHIHVNVFANTLFGLWCPKLTTGITILTESHYIPRGVHLGKCFLYSSPNWLFGSADVDPSVQSETPVYCDKDFWGMIYLEKLNIPTDCILGIMENAACKIDGYADPVLSIGDFNASKLFAYIEGNMQEEDFLLIESIMEKVENDEITLEDGIKQMKQISYYFGVYFEFEHVKGWKLQ